MAARAFKKTLVKPNWITNPFIPCKSKSSRSWSRDFCSLHRKILITYKLSHQNVFFIGEALTALPQRDVTEIPINTWTTSAFATKCFNIIGTDGLKWNMGRITKLHPANDVKWYVECNVSEGNTAANSVISTPNKINKIIYIYQETTRRNHSSLFCVI